MAIFSVWYSFRSHLRVRVNNERHARDEQLFRREARDDFVAGFGHDDFFLDARRAPAVLRGPERLERKDHSGLDLAWMLFRYQFADYRFLPDR